MPRSLTFAVLGIFSAISFAADDQPVPLPKVKPGDCWSYHAENLDYRGPIQNYTLCVTFVDYSKDVILATATVKEDGREIDLSFTSEWGNGASISGRIFTPPMRIFRFPLRVRDRY